MNLITSDIMTLSCPFLIRTDAELDAVLDKLRPRLERSVNNAGFIPLAWSKVGWVNFFSRRPVFTPADIKRQKLAVGRDTDAITDVFKTMGYQLVDTSLNDVLVSLNSGAIDAAYQSPVNAAASQIFGIAKNMSSLRIAPFMGAVLMNQSAWRSIPEKHREAVRRIGRETEAANNRNVQKMEADAIAAMLKYGLTVNDSTAEQEAEWAADINRVMPELLDKTFNKELYNEIETVLRTMRN
jgi:TRAP-type C4-dicarboxylate transport system substrate-binding protein